MPDKITNKEGLAICEKALEKLNEKTPYFTRTEKIMLCYALQSFIVTGKEVCAMGEITDILKGYQK